MLKVCTCCNGEILEMNGAYTDSGNFVCNSCLNSDYYYCDCCNTWYEDYDIMYTDDGTSVCESCYDNYYVRCDSCSDLMHTGNHTLYDVSGGDVVCGYCYDEYYHDCTQCGNVVPTGDIYYDNNSDDRYCSNCSSSLGVLRCNTCGTYYLSENTMCHNCGDGKIHHYTYKPTPQFLRLDNESTDNFVFGLELEVELAKNGSDLSDVRIDFIKTIDDKSLYIKRDGSLSYGYEIVTHPMTMGYFKEHLYKKISAIDDKFGHLNQSSNQSCGFHIHMSKEQLLDMGINIYKMIWFLEVHFDFILAFSRRDKSMLEKWANIYGVKEHESMVSLDRYLTQTLRSTDRRKIVNLTNYYTVEFRFFKGTTSYEEVLATLQFITLLCNSVKSMKMSELGALNPVTHFKGHYKELDSYLEKYCGKLGI